MTPIERLSVPDTGVCHSASESSSAKVAKPSAPSSMRSANNSERRFIISLLLSVAAGDSSGARCNNLEVFGVDLRRFALSSVVFGPQANEFTAQLLLPAHVERSESPRHWAVIGTKEFHYFVRCTSIDKVIALTLKPQTSNSFTEAIANGGFISPQYGRGHPWRSDMLRNRLKHEPDESGGCPISHGNHSNPPAHPGEFGRNQIRTRREHCSD